MEAVIFSKTRFILLKKMLREDRRLNVCNISETEINVYDAPLISLRPRLFLSTHKINVNKVGTRYKLTFKTEGCLHLWVGLLLLFIFSLPYMDKQFAIFIEYNLIILLLIVWSIVTDWKVDKILRKHIEQV